MAAPIRLSVAAPAAVLLGWTAAAILPWPDAAPIDLAHILNPPSALHWLGTDQLGRDVLARTLAGARPILAVAPAATALAVVAGAALGMAAGYAGGWIAALITRPLDAILALPLIVVALAALSALPASEGATIGVIALVFTPLVARTMRIATLRERGRDYVALAQLRGESTAFVLIAEILPNVRRPLAAESVVRLGYAIFAAASLSFLGFGRSPPSADWGLTIADTYGLMAGGAWWPTVAPAVATASLVLAVHALAERLGPGEAAAARPARRAMGVAPAGMPAALAVAGLGVRYGTAAVLRDVTLNVAPGEVVALVGESGCGKTTLALAALAALPDSAALEGGIAVAGEVPVAERRFWARQVAYVPQNPGRALTPTRTIGGQLGEVLALAGVARRDRPGAARAALERLGIADAVSVLRQYPGQISGGMAQRVLLAMAFARRPALLILDEPTTGLDAANAAAALRLARGLCRKAGAGLLLISHDLEAVARTADRVAVLYAGSLVEAGPAADVMTRPRHPYTALLLGCRPSRATRGAVLPTIAGRLPDPAALPPGCVFAPRCPRADQGCRSGPIAWTGGRHGAACRHPDMPVPAAATADAPVARPGEVLLAARHVSRTIGGRPILAGIDLSIGRAETLGLAGPSGRGKSTLGRAILGLSPADLGSTLEFDGAPLALALARRSRAQHRAIQAVFQNPDSALNPARPVGRTLARALLRLAGLRGAAMTARLEALCAAFRLDTALLGRRPGALSGGQKQRVALAHAFAAEPSLVVADEPTSALDASVQAAVLNAMADARRRTGAAMLLISHDQGVLDHAADRLMAMPEPPAKEGRRPAGETPP